MKNENARVLTNVDRYMLSISISLLPVAVGIKIIPIPSLVNLGSRMEQRLNNSPFSLEAHAAGNSEIIK